MQKQRKVLKAGKCNVIQKVKAIVSKAKHKMGLRPLLMKDDVLRKVLPAGGSRERPVPSPALPQFKSDLTAGTYELKVYAAVGFKDQSPEVNKILEDHGIELPLPLLSGPAPVLSGELSEARLVGVVLHSKPRSEARRKKHRFAYDLQLHAMLLFPLSDGRYVLTASAEPKNLGVRVLSRSGRAPRSRGVQGLRAGGAAASKRRGANRKPKLAKPKAKAEPKRSLQPKPQAALPNTRSTRNTRNTRNTSLVDNQSLSPLEEARIEEDPGLSEGSLYNSLPYSSDDGFPASMGFVTPEPGSRQSVPFYGDDDDHMMIPLSIDEPVNNIMGAAQLGM